MVEGENAEQINEEINTQTSIVSTSRSKNDRQQEAPLRQESTIIEATPSQDLGSTCKTSRYPRDELNRSRILEVQGRTQGTKLYNQIEKILKGVPLD